VNGNGARAEERKAQRQKPKNSKKVEKKAFLVKTPKAIGMKKREKKDYEIRWASTDTILEGRT